jgi:hypothetical protein
MVQLNDALDTDATQGLMTVVFKKDIPRADRSETNPIAGEYR